MATPDTQTADTAERIFIGEGEQLAWLTLGLANRHGLVTGCNRNRKVGCAIVRGALGGLLRR